MNRLEEFGSARAGKTPDGLPRVEAALGELEREVLPGFVRALDVSALSLTGP